CKHASKLGIHNDKQAHAYVISKNIHRRHLTAEQKREIVADLLKAQPEKSNNAIAKVAKVDDKTVAKVRRDLEATSEIPKLMKTVGAEGKARKQPTKKPVEKVEAKPLEENAADAESSAAVMKAAHAALEQPVANVVEMPSGEQSIQISAFLTAARQAADSARVDLDGIRITREMTDLAEAAAGAWRARADDLSERRNRQRELKAMAKQRKAKAA